MHGALLLRLLLLATTCAVLASSCCYSTSAQSVASRPSISDDTVCRLSSDQHVNHSTSARDIDCNHLLGVCDRDQSDVGRRTRSRGDSATQCDGDALLTDSTLLPDYWNLHGAIDPRIPTNGAEPPEQLVKVTDRRHRHPVFATMCSIAFLLTIITIIAVCTH